MQHYRFNPVTLAMEPTKAKVYSFKWLLLAGVALLFAGFSSGVHINTIVDRIPVYMEHKEEPCNDETVKAYIKALNLRFPDIVYRQTVLESGHYTSVAFRDLNNLLGMEYTQGRPSLGQYIGGRWAKYNNWKESIADYAIWQAQMAREVRDSNEYYELLDKIYCPINAEENRGTPYSTQLKQLKLQ